MRYLRAFIAVLAALCLFAVPASADNAEAKPLYAKDINNGSYEISVDSSSSMFRIIACTLTVTDDGMTAAMTMSGQGYEKLFMGTGEEGLTADESSFIRYAETPEGKHCFTVPVEALDVPVKCAAFSKKKQQWYDRDLVFRSDSLPSGAVKSGIDPFVIIIAASAAVVVVCGIVTIIMAKKKK